METEISPKLSIVVTTYTMERINDIYGLLDSIKNQTYTNIETIFVTERSRELHEKVKTYAEKNGIPNMVTVFNDGEPGQSPARNLGVKYTTGDIIAFVDDDTVLFSDWAEEMVRTYANDSIIGVTGPALPLWENEATYWFPEEFCWIVSCTAWSKLSELKAVRTAWGMNMSFRREAFNHCQFSQSFGHTAKEQRKAGPVVDDAEFSINLRLKTGKLIFYNPNVRVYHRVYAYRLSRRFIRGQCYWQGYSKALLKKMYPDDADTKRLVRELDLLQRILFRLVPRSVIGLFRNPSLSLRRLFFTASVLFYVALGYSAGAFPRLLGFTQKYFRS